MQLCCTLNSVLWWCLQSRAKYLSVAKQMRAYEDQLYEQWRQQVEAALPSLLKRNLLAKPASDKADDVDLDKVESETGWCFLFTGFEAVC